MRGAAARFVLLLAVAASAACASSDRASGDVPRAERYSLFQPAWVWTDETGTTSSFARWRGGPIVLAMIYTSCSSTCPRTIAKLKRVDEAFRRGGSSAQFLLVTLDPDNDDPERLASFKRGTALPATWHLLTGTRASTKDLTDLIDLHVLDDGPHIAHESRIVVFDRDGVSQKSYRCCDFPDSAAVLTSTATR